MTALRHFASCQVRARTLACPGTYPSPCRVILHGSGEVRIPARLAGESEMTADTSVFQAVAYPGVPLGCDRAMTIGTMADSTAPVGR
jgi:hypothetical protein